MDGQKNGLTKPNLAELSRPFLSSLEWSEVWAMKTKVVEDPKGFPFSLKKRPSGYGRPKKWHNQT